VFPERSLRNQNTSILTAKISDGWQGVDCNAPPEPHEVVCLIGASGSGKSTLLRCVNLVEPIDSGRVVVDGEEITLIAAP
jgi:ABC-type polar amino acid transport system ATPase subunit